MEPARGILDPVQLVGLSLANLDANVNGSNRAVVKNLWATQIRCALKFELANWVFMLCSGFWPVVLGTSVLPAQWSGAESDVATFVDGLFNLLHCFACWGIVRSSHRCVLSAVLRGLSV